MLSVAVFMMGVSTLGLYAQDSNVEPVKKDSIPTEEPKKEEPKSEAAWVCMKNLLKPIVCLRRSLKKKTFKRYFLSDNFCERYFIG